jgi:hypothetical protein
MQEVGDVFGRLTLRGVFKGTNRKKYGEFKCSCGNVVHRLAGNVFYGHTNSCGCLKKEKTIEKNTTHGKTKTREYKIWVFMLQRCYNPATNSYKYYGAKGVTVCDRWKRGFVFFLEDMGEAPNGTSLERVDRTVNYCKENCVWADDITQANNKSNNVVVEFKGKSMTLKQWSREVKIDYHALYYRWQRGWGVERMLTTPSRKKKEAA